MRRRKAPRSLVSLRRSLLRAIESAHRKGRDWRTDPRVKALEKARNKMLDRMVEERW